MNVLYVTADTGGCRHYRCVLPGLALHEAGHVVCVTGEMYVAKSGRILAGDGGSYTTEIAFDVVVMQRWMSSDAVRQVRNARAAGQVVINDVDDSFWDLPATHPNFRGVDPARNPDFNRAHYRSALAASSALTVSTPYLKDLLADLDVPVHVLPNAIDPQSFCPQPTSDTTSPTFGWVGALGFRDDGDLDILREALGLFMQAHPSCRFVHIGTRSDDPGPAPEVLGLDPARVESRPFCHVTDLGRSMHGIDVALAPLCDSPFNRAKSWIKPLEAAAAGIPVICSDMPEYRSLGVGLRCRTTADWVDAMQQTCDPVVRRSLVEAGHVAVQTHDIRSRWTDWLEVYEALIPSHAGNAAPDAEASSHPVPNVR